MSSGGGGGAAASGGGGGAPESSGGGGGGVGGRSMGSGGGPWGASEPLVITASIATWTESNLMATGLDDAARCRIEFLRRSAMDQSRGHVLLWINGGPVWSVNKMGLY